MRPVLELRDVTFRRNGKQIIDGMLGFCAAVTIPTTGTVGILGSRMGRTDLATLRRSIGHVNPRHRLQYSLTVREVVR